MSQQLRIFKRSDPIAMLSTRSEAELKSFQEIPYNMYI